MRSTRLTVECRRRHPKVAARRAKSRLQEVDLLAKVRKNGLHSGPSSVLGSWGGHFWTVAGWPGVSGFVFVLLLIGLGSAQYLHRRERQVDA